MIHAQNYKVATVQLGTVATNATTVYYVDMKGYAGVQFICSLPKPTVTTHTNTWNTLALRYGDTTSAFSALSGGVGGTDFTIPTNSDTTLFTDIVFNVVNKKGYRYLGVIIASGHTSYTTSCITANRYLADEGPPTNGGALKAVYVAA